MMSEFKGTKGVWSVAGDIVLAEEETTISFVAGSIDDEHDAHLIAAAPDLLELVMKSNHATSGSHTAAWQQKAKQAIAKALGETK